MRSARSPSANVSVPRQVSSPATVALGVGLPIGPRRRVISHSQVEHVAGADDALEAHGVDAREEGEPAGEVGMREAADRTHLRERLDLKHARHDRVPGEVAGEVPGVVLHEVAARRRARRARAR